MLEIIMVWDFIEHAKNSSHYVLILYRAKVKVSTTMASQQGE